MKITVRCYFGAEAEGLKFYYEYFWADLEVFLHWDLRDVRMLVISLFEYSIITIDNIIKMKLDS